MSEQVITTAPALRFHRYHYRAALTTLRTMRRHAAGIAGGRAMVDSLAAKYAEMFAVDERFDADRFMGEATEQLPQYSRSDYRNAMYTLRSLAGTAGVEDLTGAYVALFAADSPAFDADRFMAALQPAPCGTCGANLTDGSGDGIDGHWQNCTEVTSVTLQFPGMPAIKGIGPVIVAQD